MLLFSSFFFLGGAVQNEGFFIKALIKKMPLMKPVHLGSLKLGGFSLECSFACKAHTVSVLMYFFLELYGEDTHSVDGKSSQLLERAQPRLNKD